MNETYGHTPKSVFQQPIWVVAFALTAAVLWGFAYPLIKLGFVAYGITPSMTGSKMLFAGIRFCLSGLIILAIARATGRSFRWKSPRKGTLFLTVFSLLNTTLHYAFFYFGLSHSDGARAAILNSMSVFLLVLMACLCFESDRLTLRKAAGCVIGFAGIVSLGMGKASTAGFTLLGDGMIVLNALCSAIAGLMTRGLGKRIDVFVGTGYALALGGALLILPGLACGGTLPHITPHGLAILAMLVCISTTGFALYNKLLTCNPVGRVAIFNSLIPVIGAVSSCVVLQEPFYWKYVWAGLLSALGIFIINRGKK